MPAVRHVRLQFAPEWVAALALALLDLALTPVTGLNFHFTQGAYWLILPLLAAALATRRHSARLAMGLEYFALLILADTAVRVATYIASAQAGPLWDGEAAAVGRALGFDWIGYFHFIVDHPVVGAPLGFLYYRIGLFALLFLAVMSAAGRQTRLRETWWLVFIASLLTVLGAALLPVLGPYHTYHLQQCCGPFIAELERIRGGVNPHFPLGALMGVIQCPSFHTTLCLALPYAFRGTGVLGAGVTLLNAMILFAVPVFGGHYLADMIGGAVVFAVSLAAVRLMRRRPLATPQLVLQAA